MYVHLVACKKIQLYSCIKQLHEYLMFANISVTKGILRVTSDFIAMRLRGELAARAITDYRPTTALRFRCMLAEWSLRNCLALK